MPQQSRSLIRQAQEIALARGDHTFQMPTPCARGHTARRYASNAICCTCAANGRKNKKPEERQMKLGSASTRVVQFHQDATTAHLVTTSRQRFAEITGRPCSGSVIHKAAIGLLARYLNGAVPASDVKGLIR